MFPADSLLHRLYALHPRAAELDLCVEHLLGEPGSARTNVAFLASVGADWGYRIQRVTSLPVPVVSIEEILRLSRPVSV